MNQKSSSGEKQEHSKKLCIGKIYAEWCGHCKTLNPEWDKMKRMIKMNMGRQLKNVDVEFVEIGETDKTKSEGKTLESMLAAFNESHVMHNNEKVALNGGFPTLFRICDNHIEYYQGERRAEPMYKWYMSKCGAKSDEKPKWRGGGRKNTQRKKRNLRGKTRRGLFSWFR
jgi:hypothetical protein